MRNDIRKLGEKRFSMATAPRHIRRRTLTETVIQAASAIDVSKAPYTGL